MEVVHVAGAVTFGRELERADFDMAVCDERFEWGTAARVLLEVRDRRPHAAVAVLTEAGSWRPADLAHSGRETALPKTAAAFLALPALLRASLERAAAEESAERIEPRVRTLLERGRIGVFRLTLDGRLLEADETFLRILGARSLEEAQGLSFASLTPRLPRGFTESGKVYKHQQPLRGFGAQDVWVSLTQVVSLDEAGFPVLDGLLEQLPSRRDSEDEVAPEASHLARSNKDLGMFATMAAHELQEPLRTIEQSTRMLLEDVGTALPGDAERSADQVVGGVRRLQSMIDGLLTLARFGGAERGIESCNCNAIVDEVMSGLQARVDETGARVKIKALPTVRADPMQLRLVFRNLISNAMKFHGDAPPKVRVAARQEDDDWVFSVEDEGIGIAPEQAERIFEQFTRAGGGGGAGLGLAICRQVVERHGGRIWVESEPLRGSTFYFTIPLSVAASESPDGRPDEADGGAHHEARGEAG